MVVWLDTEVGGWWMRQTLWGLGGAQFMITSITFYFETDHFFVRRLFSIYWVFISRFVVGLCVERPRHFTKSTDARPQHGGNSAWFYIAIAKPISFLIFSSIINSWIRYLCPSGHQHWQQPSPSSSSRQMP